MILPTAQIKREWTRLERKYTNSTTRKWHRSCSLPGMRPAWTPVPSKEFLISYGTSGLVAMKDRPTRLGGKFDSGEEQRGKDRVRIMRGRGRIRPSNRLLSGMHLHCTLHSTCKAVDCKNASLRSWSKLRKIHKINKNNFPSMTSSTDERDLHDALIKRS